MSQTEAGPSSTRQFQTAPATEFGISSGREVVGQAILTIMQVIAFALSIAGLLIAPATLALAQECEQENEILLAPPICAQAAHPK